MAVHVRIVTRRATCLVLALLFIAGACGCASKGDAGRERLVLEVRNESPATIYSGEYWNDACDRGPRCVEKAGGGAWHDKFGLPPGSVRESFGSGHDVTSRVVSGYDMTGIALVVGEKNPLLVWREGLRPIEMNEICVVTLTEGLDIEVEYQPARPGDPPRKGVTRREPAVPPLEPKEALVVRVYHPNGAVIENAELRFTVEGTKGWPAVCPKLEAQRRGGGLWISRRDFEDVELHLLHGGETGPCVWKMTIMAKDLGSRTLRVDPRSPEEIVCRFSKP